MEASGTDQQALLAGALHDCLGRLGVGDLGPRFDQFDTDHQALAADLADHFLGLGQVFDRRLQLLADLLTVGLQVLGQQVFDVGLGTGHRDRVAAEGRDRISGDAIHDLGAGDHPADGEAVAGALGEGQQIGLEPVGLDAPEILAGAAPTGLHLVGDEQNPVLVEHLLHLAEEAVRRGDEAAHTLDRFGDHRRHITCGGDVEHVAQIVHTRRDELVVGQMAERAAVLVPAVDVGHVHRTQRRRRPGPIAGDRNRRKRATVIRVAHRQDLIRLPVRRGQQQGGVVGFGTRIGEEHLGIGNRRKVGHHLGEFDLLFDQIQRRRVEHLLRLLLDGLDHAGRLVPGHRGQDAAKEVEVLLALGVHHPPTVTFDDRNRVFVIERQPVRQLCPMPCEQVFVLTHQMSPNPQRLPRSKRTDAAAESVLFRRTPQCAFLFDLGP